jgi:PAS domain S-box-containing protein
MSRMHWSLRYVLAVGAVAAGLLLRLALAAWVGPGLPTYITFYPPVMVAALLGGLGPGLLATALCALAADYWLLEPAPGFGISSLRDAVGQGLFACMGVFISTVVHLYQRARLKAAAYDQEVALRETRREKEFLADLLEHAAQPFAVGYPDGRIGRLNRAYEELTGYSAAELRALDWSTTLTPPEWRELERQKLDELHRTGQPVRYEKEYVRKDGSRVPVELLVHLVCDETGKPEYLYSFVTDITERRRAAQAEEARQEALLARQAEEAQRLISAYNRSLLEASLDPLVTIDAAGKITDVNAATEKVTGCARQDLIGTDFSSYFTEPEKARAGYQQVFREGAVQDYALEIRHRDGHHTPVLYNASVYRDAEGATRGVFAAARDITERRRVEEELHRLNEELELRVAARTADLAASNKELEAFAYSVSHDLRGPLRAMDGFSQALLEDYADKLDAAGQDHLRRVRVASQRMGDLIDGLLGLSRTTRSEMHRTAVDLSALAEGVALELRKTEPARNVNFVIVLRLRVSADANLLRIVLENLLGNAWKFTSKHPQTRIEVGALQRDGETVYFVRDDGAGFDMAYVNNLFGVFRRLHSMTEFEGTGVGLATVQRIVHRHGGQVWAEGQVEQGATFYFTLPVEPR